MNYTVQYSFGSAGGNQQLLYICVHTIYYEMTFKTCNSGELVLSFFLGSSVALFLAIGVLLCLPEKSPLAPAS